MCQFNFILTEEITESNLIELILRDSGFGFSEKPLYKSRIMNVKTVSIKAPDLAGMRYIV